ncbi:acyl-CoA synthetase [Halovivax gelatinilyticus]|uniref:acyl-CoA synthetase n=1 Tax=Halovivax gelatinilyticus TaxID=2961597 RepID=UPI0020CA940B|nr:AMP-binding protein [Halovivax gelatinilyticus]
MASRAHYRFDEREWDDYEALREWFEWVIPDRFNVTRETVGHWATKTPDEPAVIAVDGGDEIRLTYRELYDRVGACASALASRGVDRGDRVAVNAPQRVETLVGHLAAWTLGAVSVPLSMRFGPDALAYRLGDCDVTAAIVDGSRLDAFARATHSDAVRTLSHVLVVDPPADADGVAAETTPFDAALAAEATDDGLTPVETAPDDDAMIIYTSGTTGDPKGVRHTHSFLLGHLPTAVTGFFNLDPQPVERFYTPVEWSWVGPLWAFCLPALYYGKTVVGDAGRFDPERVLELVDRYDVTRLLGPATVWRRLDAIETPRERFDTDSVSVVMSAGESMGERELETVEDCFAGAVVHEGYGQTEAMNLIMDCEALVPKRASKMGKPTPGVDVRIVDPETGEPTVPTGEVGEIAVQYGDGHPLCFEEYWNQPDRTAEKVRDGWLLTEDLGFVDEAGYVEFESRKDDVIICSGYRISPDELQETLVAHEAVANAGVVGVPDDDHGHVPKAVVVLEAGYDPSDELTETLQSYVKTELAMYEYPRVVEYRDELPTTGSGKVERSALTD